MSDTEKKKNYGTPTIYIKNRDLMDAIDNIADQVHMSRSALVCKLLTETINSMCEMMPEETATGLRFRIKNMVIDFEGKN